MKKLKIAIPVLVILLIIAWYAFRPERLFINNHVKEELPTNHGDVLKALASGTFHSGAHETRGSATIYELSNGSRVLRFTNFTTSNGPDVHVYMVASDDAVDSASVLHSNFIDLGTIKANTGDQNYSLGQDIDLSKYRTVSVWCKRFSVNFGAAPLKHAQS
jgi:hypothetical protein